MEAQKAVGKALRSIRKDKRITIVKLSELSGMTRQALGNIERGVTNMHLLSIIVICQALKAHPREVMERAFK
jgi:transcriptional regulator with XRE-family HTH domain